MKNKLTKTEHLRDLLFEHSLIVFIAFCAFSIGFINQFKLPPYIMLVILFTLLFFSMLISYFSCLLNPEFYSKGPVTKTIKNFFVSAVKNLVFLPLCYTLFCSITLLVFYSDIFIKCVSKLIG